VVATLAGIGLVQGAIMAGGVLGAPAAPRLQGRLRPRTMSLTITVAGTLLFVAAALLMPSPLVALPVAVVVLLAPAANSGLFAATLRQTPDRVVSTMSVLAMGLAALAPLLAGLLVEHVSASWAVGAFAAANAIAAVLTLVMPGLQNADPSPPNQPEQA
jgi:MFS family permease